MSIIVEFFVAPDDAAAAGVLDAGPEGVFESVPFGNFVAGTAVIEWESILTGRASADLVALGMPRIVADARDGGLSLVFAFSSALRSELAAADDARLDRVASEWARRDAVDGDAFDPEMARIILDDVAGLARLAEQDDHEVYCRLA
ncbi:hypothetical protein [Actinoallomurus iriomotensis]|uniref:hypothetical protein n=1 Tax=Actinoallomurus iriomotensis TaxID=478107 RepID=UPI002555C783|nr:hypothetical protein [Actinoallomurus iriomotensis]